MNNKLKTHNTMELKHQEERLKQFGSVGKLSAEWPKAESKMNCDILHNPAMPSIINFRVTEKIEARNAAGGEFLFEAETNNLIENNSTRPPVDLLLDLFRQSIELISTRLITECTAGGYKPPVALTKLTDDELIFMINHELNKNF